MDRPERHHIPPSWELYEYRNGRWIAVSHLRGKRRSGPKPNKEMRPQGWVMRKAAYLLAEMIRKQKRRRSK